MRAVKFVPATYAEGALTGVFRVGTLSSYATLESSRADPYDGGVAVHSGAQHGDRAWTALQRMGLASPGPAGFTGGNINIAHVTVLSSSPRAYCFCMSEVGTVPPERDGPQVGIEILGVRTLAQRMRELAPDRLGPATARRVRYRRVEFMALNDDDPPPPNPFVKGPGFIHEREIRIIFQPLTDAPIEPFLLPADDKLAALLGPPVEWFFQ